MSGFNNIPTPMFKSDFMMVCQKNIGVNRAQQQDYGHLLTIMSKKLRKGAKPHGKNPPSRKDMRRKPKMLLMLLQTKL